MTLGKQPGNLPGEYFPIGEALPLVFTKCTYVYGGKGSLVQILKAGQNHDTVEYIEDSGLKSWC